MKKSLSWAGGITVAALAVVLLGAVGNPYLSYYHNIVVYTNAYVAKTNFMGTAIVTNTAKVGTSLTLSDDNTNAVITTSAAELDIKATKSGGSIWYWISGAWRWWFDSSGTFKPVTDGGADIGTPAAQVGNLYVKSNIVLNGGTVNTNTPFAKTLHDAPDAATARTNLNAAPFILTNGMYVLSGTNGSMTIFGDGPVYSGLAKVQPYPAIGTAPYGITLGTTNGSQEYLFLAYDHRLRQDGSVREIGIGYGTNTVPTYLTIRFWRTNAGAGTFNLIGETEDIASRVTNSAVSYITLTNSVTGLLQGDYYGLLASNGVGVATFSTETVALPSRGYYKADQAPAATTANWLTNSSLNYLVSVGIYMDRPDAIFVGDSIVQGAPNNYAFTQTNSSTFNRATYWGDIVAKAVGWTYQNMGHGSDTTSNIVARFSVDVTNARPRYVIMEGGINDALTSVPAATTIANISNNVQSALSVGSVVIIVPILPSTSAGNVPMQTRDTVNASITNLANCIVVTGTDAALGVFRAGGDAGNLWDINPAYNADGWHLNAAGSQVLANLVVSALSSRTLQPVAVIDTHGAVRPNYFELLSPDGNKWRASLDNSGTLTWSRP